MNYYQVLGDSSEPARRVGWLRRVGQAYRFEIVRQLLSPGDRVVDLGCGDAALAAYLADSGERFSYLGVEMRREVLESEQPHGSEVVFGDMFDFEPDEQDVVIGLGCLVDGETRSNPAMRFRARNLLERMQMGRAGVLMAADLDSLPDWRRDGAVGGIRAAWFGEGVDLMHPCRDEIALIWGGDVDAVGARRSVENGPWGPWDPAELAWLAERCGAADDARGFLAGDVSDRALAALVGERLDGLS